MGLGDVWTVTRELFDRRAGDIVASTTAGNGRKITGVVKLAHEPDKRPWRGEGCVNGYGLAMGHFETRDEAAEFAKRMHDAYVEAHAR